MRCGKIVRGICNNGKSWALTWTCLPVPYSIFEVWLGLYTAVVIKHLKSDQDFNNISNQTSLPTPNSSQRPPAEKTGWNRISAESSIMSPRRPNRSRDWTELNWIRHLKFDQNIHTSTIIGHLKADLDFQSRFVERRAVCPRPLDPVFPAQWSVSPFYILLVWCGRPSRYCDHCATTG